MTVDLILHKSVKVALHERMRQSQYKRVGGEVLHASSLTDEAGFCAREHVLLPITGKSPPSKSIPTSLRMTFDMGYAVQDIVGSYLTDLLWGSWQCSRCGVLIHCSLYPEECPNAAHGCSGGTFKYEEPRFTSEVSGISGGIDFVLKFPGHELMRIVELKTMEKDGFASLKAPVAAHRLRTNLYLRIVEETDWGSHIDTQEASILYVDKGFGKKDDGLLAKHDLREATSPFKEYTIKRDDSGLEAIHKAAHPIKVHQETGRIPSGICVGYMDKRASKCPVRDECFSTKYPPGSIAS